MYFIKGYNQKANHIRRNNTNDSPRRMGSFKTGKRFTNIATRNPRNQYEGRK